MDCQGPVEYGVDYHGNDITVDYDVDHWQRCAWNCADNWKCLFWTYNIRDKWCVHKSSDNGRYPVPHAISGHEHCVHECSGN